MSTSRYCGELLTQRSQPPLMTGFMGLGGLNNVQDCPAGEDLRRRRLTDADGRGTAEDDGESVGGTGQPGHTAMFNCADAQAQRRLGGHRIGGCCSGSGTSSGTGTGSRAVPRTAVDLHDLPGDMRRSGG